MKTMLSRPVLSQTENNTTLWIGHLSHDANDRLAGQTFSCPAGGQLNNIQIYSSAVTHVWGPSLGKSTLEIERNDESRWLRFELDPVNLQQNGHYAFRLQTEKGIIGIGEAASHARKPFVFGQEWSSDTSQRKDNFYSYFSLAFKVELCA